MFIWLFYSQVYLVVTQAFIVAFTSDMIPRLVYMYAYNPEHEMNMKGYINNSLSIFNISAIPPESRPEDGENPAWFNSSINTCRWVCVRACVCMYVCVYEKDRGRKREGHLPRSF